MPRYLILEKQVGETPLDVIRAYKAAHPELAALPMAYAGRLDPMASGQLLVLIGDECKRQKAYHALDKAYRFEVLLGTSSDTGDILGLVEWKEATDFDAAALRAAARQLVGPLSLPYPQFSSKTVRGKPLHTWTLENRLDEIDMPTADTIVYKLNITSLRAEAAEQVYENALGRIASIPPVTDASKALGRDFRRQDVRAAWERWREHHQGQQVQIAAFDCAASSGTYMRSLAEAIAQRLGTSGLAYSIHRYRIGRYQPLPFGAGFWWKRYN